MSDRLFQTGHVDVASEAEWWADVNRKQMTGKLVSRSAKSGHWQRPMIHLIVRHSNWAVGWHYVLLFRYVMTARWIVSCNSCLYETNVYLMNERDRLTFDWQPYCHSAKNLNWFHNKMVTNPELDSIVQYHGDYEAPKYIFLGGILV